MRCTSKFTNGTNPPQIFSNATWPHAPTMNLLACHDDMVKMGVHHAKVMLHRLIIEISLLKITCRMLFHSVIKIEQCPRNVYFFFLPTGYHDMIPEAGHERHRSRNPVKASPRPNIHASLNPHSFWAIFLRRQSYMRHGGTHVQKSKNVWDTKTGRAKTSKKNVSKTGLPVRTRSSCNVFITFITIKHP